MNQIPPVSAHPSAVSPSPQSPVGGNAALFRCCDRWSRTVPWFMDELSQSVLCASPHLPQVSNLTCMYVCLWLFRVGLRPWGTEQQRNYVQNHFCFWITPAPITVNAVILYTIKVNICTQSHQQPGKKKPQSRSEQQLQMFNSKILYDTWCVGFSDIEGRSCKNVQYPSPQLPLPRV